jgi:hypothetical protein
MQLNCQNKNGATKLASQQTVATVRIGRSMRRILGTFDSNKPVMVSEQRPRVDQRTVAQC